MLRNLDQGIFRKLHILETLNLSTWADTKKNIICHPYTIDFRWIAQQTSWIVQQTDRQQKHGHRN